MVNQACNAKKWSRNARTGSEASTGNWRRVNSCGEDNCYHTGQLGPDRQGLTRGLASVSPKLTGIQSSSVLCVRGSAYPGRPSDAQKLDVWVLVGVVLPRARPGRSGMSSHAPNGVDNDGSHVATWALQP